MSRKVPRRFDQVLDRQRGVKNGGVVYGKDRQRLSSLRVMAPTISLRTGYRKAE